jgi:hypothetical protein
VSQPTHTGEFKGLVFLAVFLAVVVAAEGMGIEVVVGVEVVALVVAEAVVGVELLNHGHLQIEIVTMTSPSLLMSRSKRKSSFPSRNELKKTPVMSSRVGSPMVVVAPTTVTTSASWFGCLTMLPITTSSMNNCCLFSLLHIRETATE